MSIAIVIASVLITMFIVRKIVHLYLEKSIYELNKEDKIKTQTGINEGIERISINTKQGLLIGHWLLKDLDAPSIFIVHGNGETVSDWVDAQLLLHKMGYSSFVFDYSGFGNSTGKTTTSNLYKNTKVAWTKFCKLSPIDTPKITIGHSLGSAFLLATAHKFAPIPNKIMTYGAFSSARGIAAYMNKIPKNLIWLIPNILNNKANIKQITLKNISIAHSKNDKKIPFAMSEVIAKNNSLAKLKLLEDYHHNDLYDKPKEELWRMLLEN